MDRLDPTLASPVKVACRATVYFARLRADVEDAVGREVRGPDRIRQGRQDARDLFALRSDDALRPALRSFIQRRASLGYSSLATDPFLDPAVTDVHLTPLIPTQYQALRSTKLNAFLPLVGGGA
jgi:hypothetical protein